MLNIRAAETADIPAISEIYDWAIARTNAVWRDQPTGRLERAQWLAGRQGEGFPVLVAERAGAVVGFASYGAYRAFEGYRFTVENSVFVAPAAQGAGVGRALMEALIARAKHARLHIMIAAIDGDNSSSIALHAALGFTEAGRLPQMGAKSGRWLDLVLMHLFLDARAAP